MTEAEVQQELRKLAAGLGRRKKRSPVRSSFWLATKVDELGQYVEKHEQKNPFGDQANSPVTGVEVVAVVGLHDIAPEVFSPYSCGR